MGIIEILVVGVGLSMDAFAVSMCRGLCMRKINYRHSIVIALFFGVFQALMPLIGWVMATSFEKYITDYDHWTAFALLLFIGCKMIWDAFHDGEDDKSDCDAKLNIKGLFLMAVATSIDALAVGVSFAFLGLTFGEILFSVTIIGVVTFTISFGGVIIGNRFGVRFKRKAEIAGGIVLIMIGVKILLEHLEVISF